jgi:hypothetical protein
MDPNAMVAMLAAGALGLWVLIMAKMLPRRR